MLCITDNMCVCVDSLEGDISSSHSSKYADDCVFSDVAPCESSLL
jgi:hypothetical protein